jgi:hypothetical protein
MTVSEKHAEWISLLEVSGSFLAVAVLEEAFPQGLDKITTPFRQRIRSAYDEWRDAVDESDPQIDAIHREWLSLVIRDFLEHDDSVLKSATDLPVSLQYHDVQSDSTIRPDFAVMAGSKAKLLISVTPPNTDLENPLPSESWLASPAERLIALCRTSGVSVGLVTNGERWMVVSVPADGGSSRASWYARLWFQEPVTLQAFYSLLGVRRCFGQEDQTLEALLQKSLGHQDEITDTLGEQVRRAVEVLVQALDRADLDRNRTLLKDVTPEQLFEAGLTVMMRLVVILCAEERGLLLLGEPVYDQNYAISTLRAQLVGQAHHGLEILERREDAWSRLLATFRGVYGGITHETLRLPPLGGSLFDPDRFPFLEGRDQGTCWLDTAALPLPIDNRTVLLLLNALQVLEHKSGAQLLSYESLDVEQIGHVYEGLLERTVKRVPEVTLGLVANSGVRKKSGHPELCLSELEKMTKAGDGKLQAFLIEKTGRSKSALTNDLTIPLSQKNTHRLLTACGGDLALTARIMPFGNLIRTDSWGDPLVYREGAFIVTHGAGRRETGSHYTPKVLTEPIVQHTLEPIVYTGPAEGNPREQWRLKSSAEILSLKVCDMAMGSGAFLVQTCRWLGERLVEAWDMEQKTGRAISIEGVILNDAGESELLPSDQAERVLIARRLIANRCLYGVDINPMAVELAKLSLWLITMMRNRPFSFLDHALKSGDSLLGVSQVNQLERFSLRDPDHSQPLLETANLWRDIEHAAAVRRALESMPSHTTGQIGEKARLHTEAESQLAKLRSAADFLVAAELDSSDARGWDTRRAVAASSMQAAWEKEIPEFKRLAQAQLQGRRPFHWPLEFPEIFEINSKTARSLGFDAFVGNPPFMGGKKITGIFGTDYRNLLVKVLAFDRPGAADLTAFFFLRAFSLVKLQAGCLGMLGTNTLAQGDTREVGLDQICGNGNSPSSGSETGSRGGGVVMRAFSSMRWPGTASLEVCCVWIRRGEWNGNYILDGKHVTGITPFLTVSSSVSGTPYRLAANTGKSFMGTIPLGRGFVLSPQEAADLIARDPRNRDVLFPYMNGEDLNTRPDQSPARWIINFFDWPLDRKHDDPKSPKGPPYASDYPECLERVTNGVKPLRDTQKKKPYRERWWQYAERCARLYEAIADCDRVLVKTLVSPTWAFEIVDSQAIFDQKVIVLCSNPLGLLQSSIHWAWSTHYGSTLGKITYNYAPTDCFETFPFPQSQTLLVDVGERYQILRREIMLARQEGLTKLYKRFHDRGENSDDILLLRALQVEMDQSVAEAYAWNDLSLDHGFHETKQGSRYTISDTARTTILDRLLQLNHLRYAEEVVAGLHDKKRRSKKSAVDQSQEPELEFEIIKPLSVGLNLQKNITEPGRSSAEVGQSELLNAIFTCVARRAATDREELARQVADTLGFKRLSANLREVIASGINSAIRRGIVSYDSQNIHRIAARFAELDNEVLVNAINASVRPGCVYTPDEVLHRAAEHLGCQRIKEAFRERLESALTAASRRGILTKRGDEIRKA